MPLYRCTLVDRQGRETELLREAPSPAAVAQLFPSGELFLVSVKEAGEGEGGGGLRLSRATVGEFTAVLSTLLESGLSLKDALQVAEDIARDRKVKLLCAGILDSLRKGDSLSTALAAWGESFPPLYLGMVKIGERVGSLEKVIPGLSTYLESQKKIRDRVSGALAYPILVLCVAIGGAVAIMTFLVPRVLEMFRELGGEGAALVERNVRTMNLVMAILGLLLLGAFVFALVAGIARRRGGPLSLAADRLLLRLPIAGKVILSLETLNFSYAMETLASGGIAVEEGLKEALSVVSNRAYREALRSSCDAVLAGEALSAAFARHRELPPHVAQWMAIGERTGQVDRVFHQLRLFYQADVERKSQTIMTLVEPLLILFVGGLVLLLVFLFVIPLFTMYQAII